MTFESLLANIQIACPKWTQFIEARPLADGKSCSFFFFSQLGFKLILGKKKSRIEIDPSYVSDPEAISSTTSYSASGVLFLNYGGDFNLGAFLDVVKVVCDDKRSNVTVERFGCCSSYVECSDVKCCLHEENFEYLGCYYRENLEVGRIFYGVNKTI